MNQHVCRFFFGLLFSPLVILLHESAHYAVAASYGFERQFHFARIHVPPHQFTSPVSFLVVIAAGPCIDLAFAVGGFIWLQRLRRGRWEAVATRADWMATFFVLCSFRWLRCFTGTLRDPQPMDEAMISELFGLPKWFLPYALAPLAIGLMLAAIRLHPRGSRLLPFASALLAVVAGRVLWMNVLGPQLLP